MRTKRIVLLGILSLALAGCQTQRVIDRPTPVEISRLDRGALVGVLLTDGSRHELAVTEVTDTQLTGTERGRTVAVPIDKIEEICLRERATRGHNALERVLAALAAGLALTTGDQDSVNSPSD